MTAKDSAGFFLELASHENRKFWKSLAEESPNREGVVIVDCSQRPRNSNTHLFYGAQLAYTLNADLVCLSMDAPSAVPTDEVRQWEALVQSYCPARHVKMDGKAVPAATMDRARSLMQGFQTRNDVEAFEIDGVALGRMMLSDMSRSLRKPDIGMPDLDAKMVGIFLHLYEQVVHHFSTQQVKAYLSTHFTYREGIATQYAIRHGIPVYQHLRTAGNSLFRAVEPDLSLRRAGDLYAAWSHELMRPYLDMADPEIIELADLAFENRYAPMCKRPGWWPGRSLNLTFSEIDVQKVLGKRRVVLICMHAHSDANWGFTGHYEAYYDWIQDTLKIISAPEAQDALYIFKDHPIQNHYVRRAFVAELRNQIEALENAIYVTESISHDMFAKFCDLAVTVRGSTAIEAVGSGMPCVTLGTGLTTGSDIAIEARDRDHYETLLIGPTPDKPSAEQIRRARVFHIFLNFIFVHETTFLPPFKGLPNHFMAFFDRVKSYDREKDPSWETLRRLVDGKSPIIALSREEVLDRVREEYKNLRQRQHVFEHSDLNDLNRRLSMQKKSMDEMAREVRPFVKVGRSFRNTVSRVRRKIRRVHLPLAIYRRLPLRLKAYAVAVGQDDT